MESFTPAELERSRRYHRPLYAVRLVELVLGIAVLAALAFGRVGQGFDFHPWWTATAGLAALVLGVQTVVFLPSSIWRYRRERAWGFSTQSLGAWLADRAKAFGIGSLIT